MKSVTDAVFAMRRKEERTEKVRGDGCVYNSASALDSLLSDTMPQI